MIHPDSLHYFLELASTLHMSRSAARLGVSQPTLSHSLRRLEEELGHPLFIRTKKGLILTLAGERLLSQAQALQGAWDNLERSMAEDVEAASGRIRLGCHTAVAQYTLPAFLPNLLKQHPKLNIILNHGLSRHMTEMVISHQLDIALVVNPLPHPDLIIKEIARDQVSIWKAETCHNPDLLLVEPALLQSQNILSKLAKKGIRFSRQLESSSLEVIAQLLNSGTGCAILPERVVKAFANQKLIRMKNSPVFEDRICVVYQKEFRRLKRSEVFLQSLQNAFTSEA